MDKQLCSVCFMIGWRDEASRFTFEGYSLCGYHMTQVRHIVGNTDLRRGLVDAVHAIIIGYRGTTNRHG